jgi:hypothetical protein
MAAATMPTQTVAVMVAEPLRAATHMADDKVVGWSLPDLPGEDGPDF